MRCAWPFAADSKARIGRSARLGECELAVNMQRVFGDMRPAHGTSPRRMLTIRDGRSA